MTNDVYGDSQAGSTVRQNSRKQRVDRKQELRRVATRLFADNGFGATSTRDLAAALGILPGSVYAHITSKEELLYEILLEAGDLGEQALSRIANSDRPASQRLADALRVSLSEMAKSPDLARILEKEWESLTGERRKRIIERRDALEGYWARIIEDGIAEGSFRCDPKLGRLFVLSVERHFIQWFRPDGALTAEEIAEHLTSMVLSGLTGGRAAEPGAERDPRPERSQHSREVGEMHT